MDVVLAHEHLALNFFNPGTDRDAGFSWTRDSLAAAAAHGVVEVWDLTNQTFGRDLDVLAALSEATGVRIVASTGHYLDRFHPEETRSLSADQIARLWMRDLKTAAGPVRVGIIGEIATSHGVATEHERRAFQAAAMAQLETGAPIYTHTTYGTLAREQLAMLLDAGALPDRVIIGHADVLHARSDVMAVLEGGAMVGVDTVGKEKWRALDGSMHETPDSGRLELVRDIVNAGYAERVVLSSDLLYERHELELNPETFGTYGYSYLPVRFLAKLRGDGVTEDAIRSMAGLNASRLAP